MDAVVFTHNTMNEITWQQARGGGCWVACRVHGKRMPGAACILLPVMSCQGPRCVTRRWHAGSRCTPPSAGSPRCCASAAALTSCRR